MLQEELYILRSGFSKTDQRHPRREAIECTRKRSYPNITCKVNGQTALSEQVFLSKQVRRTVADRPADRLADRPRDR